MPDDTLEITRNCECCGEAFSTEDPEQDVCNECFPDEEDEAEDPTLLTIVEAYNKYKHLDKSLSEAHVLGIPGHFLADLWASVKAEALKQGQPLPLDPPPPSNPCGEFSFTDMVNAAKERQE